MINRYHFFIFKMFFISIVFKFYQKMLAPICMVAIFFCVPFTLVSCFDSEMQSSKVDANNSSSTSSQAGDTDKKDLLFMAEVDKATATPGEVIRYTVTLDMEPSIQAVMPDVFNQIKDLRISDMTKEGPVNLDGRTVFRHIFMLQADEEGSYILPSLKIDYISTKGEKQVAGIPQIFLEIKQTSQNTHDPSSPNSIDSGDIKDIKPVEHPPRSYKELALLALFLAIIFSAVVAVFYLYKNRKKKIVKSEAPLLPWDYARNALKALEAKRLLELGEIKSYYYEISEIFRRYLEKRYDFPAMEETTEEIFSSLKKQKIPLGKERDLAVKILTGTDAVKYAKRIPTETESRDLFFWVNEFVDLTEPPKELSPVLSDDKEVAI